jgi:hypothetical protein
MYSKPAPVAGSGVISTNGPTPLGRFTAMYELDCPVNE